VPSAGQPTGGRCHIGTRWRDARVVANVAVLLVVALIGWYLVSIVRRHRRGLVAERGVSIGADLGTLGDTPRVRVSAVLKEGSDRVRLILAGETGPDSEPGPAAPPDLDLLVFLREEEFGYGVLHEWKRSGSPVAIVQPPGSHIVRLRSVDSLQHLTLRRVDEE
jgi:hypothetical protein